MKKQVYAVTPTGYRNTMWRSYYDIVDMYVSVRYADVKGFRYRLNKLKEKRLSSYSILYGKRK